MHLQPEDPRITAYLLGELSAEDAGALERAAAEDPMLLDEIGEMRSIQHFLTERLTLPADKLRHPQRENIRRAAKAADSSGKTHPITSFVDALTPWIIPSAAAAVLALATLILSRTPGAEEAAPVAVTKWVRTAAAPPSTVVVQSPSEVAQLAPIPANSPPPAAILPPPVLPPAMPHGSVAVADFPVLNLPILSAHSDLESISKSIHTDHQLPPRSSVRLEEILNGFPLRLNGVTAIARAAANNWHPDNRDSGLSAYAATLSTEMIACPWKPSATLLFISLRGNPNNACDVRIAYHANTAGVARYRLLGSAPAEGPLAAELPTKLAADATATLAIEIESSKPGGDLGSLEWSTDGQPAATIALVHKSDAEPSDDARFAALVCTYAQWLAGEQEGIIDADIISALAREISSTTLATERADFLNLIESSLHL